MNEIYFEYVVQGAYVKVSAIEPETKTEAVVVVPRGLTEEQMKFQALQKLLLLFRSFLKKKFPLRENPYLKPPKSFRRFYLLNHR